MSEVVQVYTPSLPQDMKEKVLSANADTLQKLANRAANLIATLKATASQSIGSSYAVVTGLSQTFDSSGGLLFIFGTVNYRIGSANSGRIGLFIDDIEEMNSGDGVNGHGSVLAAVQLAKGSHRIEVKAKTDSGTMTVNGNLTGDISSLYISEIIL